MAARDWRVTRAFAGRWRKWASLTRFVWFRSRAMKEPAHLALHPFGQIPTYEEGDLGSVRDRRDRVPYRRAPCGPVAGRCRMPGRARSPGCSPRSARWSRRSSSSQTPGSWSATSPGTQQRMPLVEDRVRERLGQLSVRLGDADWLDGAFSAGDLMMVSVAQTGRSGPIFELPVEQQHQRGQADRSDEQQERPGIIVR